MGVTDFWRVRLGTGFVELAAEAAIGGALLFLLWFAFPAIKCS